MASTKPASKEDLRNIGSRNVIQIVPTRDTVRPHHLHDDDSDTSAHRPLTAPTGPGGADNFHNVAGSQIKVPHVTNIYMGEFWGDREFVEGFSKAVVENGYLDPLKELKYGTGSGKYLGSFDGTALKARSTFSESDAEATLKQLQAAKKIHVTENSLFMLILPKGVSASTSDGAKSCSQFCGFHDAFEHGGKTIAFAVLPSSLCKGCGGKIGDFTAVYAHELAEACTDKVPGKGWVADDGEENGDLEAWDLFGWGPPEDPNRYTVQGYYTNERGNTTGKWKSS